MDAIDVKGLCKTFDHKGEVVTALNNIDLTVPRGEIIGFLGPNGAGKTTFISILTGLLEKDSGTVKILGMDLDQNLEKLKENIGVVSGFSMVSQDLTVREFLKYYGHLYGVKNLNRRIDEVVDLLGITEKKEDIAKDLSSGYKQRLIIAKALLNKPKVLFLDEPTVGLDVEIAVKVRNLILDLKKQGTTVLLTSHNLHEVEQLCDRIALINKGLLVALGSIKEIKSTLKETKEIIILCEDIKKATETLAKLKDVKRFSVSGNEIIVNTENSKKVFNSLIEANVGIESYAVKELSLEDAFLGLVKE